MKASATTRSNLLSLLLLILASDAAPQTAHHLTTEELRSDLRSVIILAGYPCNSVVEFTNPIPSDYHVSCDADRLYRVHISEEKGIVIENRSAPEGAVSDAETGHEAFVRRQLFAIVNLAGHECDRVVYHEVRGARDSIVTCDDQTTYRVHVTPEGRVEVDRHSTIK
jgi:hypothetical protein